MELPVRRELIKEAISEVIDAKGLDVITSAIIREFLSQKFDKDFSCLKKQIDEITREKVEEIMATKKQKEESEEDSDKDDDKESCSSESETEVRDKEKPLSPQNTADGKALKERRRKMPTNDSDDDLITKIKRRRGTQSSGTRKTKKAPATRKVTGNSHFSKICYVTEELQAITGKPYMRRCDVVKAMWNYINENNLKNPKNKKVVICDEALKKIFKKPQFQGFGMMSVLKNHILDPNELGSEHMELANEAKKQLIEELNKDLINDNADGEFVNKGAGDESESD